MTAGRLLVVVADPGDALADGLAAAAGARGAAVLRVAPGGLGDLAVSLAGDEFRAAGRPVGGVLFRAAPEAAFGAGFAAEDRAFADAELGATWLAALQLPTLVAVNRFDAAAWFDGAGWAVWRRRLRAAGVPVAPFAFGAARAAAGLRWHPYLGAEPRRAPGPASRRALAPALTKSRPYRRSLIVGGEVVAGAAGPAARAAARALEAAGVRLAELATDEAGRVLRVTAEPRVADPAASRRAVERLVDLFAGGP